jgi:hypothetical protein
VPRLEPPACCCVGRDDDGGGDNSNAPFSRPTPRREEEIRRVEGNTPSNSSHEQTELASPSVGGVSEGLAGQTILFHDARRRRQAGRDNGKTLWRSLLGGSSARPAQIKWPEETGGRRSMIRNEASARRPERALLSSVPSRLLALPLQPHGHGRHARQQANGCLAAAERRAARERTMKSYIRGHPSLLV